MATIGSLMRTEIITAEPGESLSHAAYVMTTNGVGAVLVVEEGKLVGVLSERDILTRVVGEGGDVLETRVADIATADPDDSLVVDLADLGAANGVKVAFVHIPSAPGVPDLVTEDQMHGLVRLLNARDVGYVGRPRKPIRDDRPTSHGVCVPTPAPDWPPSPVPRPLR